MKKTIVFISFIISVLFSYAQTGDSLRVYWNRQLALEAVNTGKDTSIVNISRTTVTKTAAFEIVLKQAVRQDKWKRVFQLTDTLNNIFFQKEFAYTNGRYVLQDNAMQSFMKKHKNMLVYTFVQPPAGAGSNIRIARILLFKSVIR